MTATDRKRAAAMARDLIGERVSFEAFATAFGNSRDELIADLFDLIEHEPRRGGLFGVSERRLTKYRANIERAIRALEEP